MVNSTFFFDELISLTIKPVGENLVHHRMLEPVRSLCALVVDGNLIGWRHVGINTTAAPQMLHIVAIIAGTITAGNNEIIPEQTALCRHLHFQRIVTDLCFLRVFGGQWQKFFPLLVLPKSQQYLINLLL